MEFKNKSVIITGAGYGIGRACALSFYKQGAKLTLIDKNNKTLAETIEIINRYKRVGLYKNTNLINSSVFDIKEQNRIINLVNSTIELNGTIDILINNAGVTQFKHFTDTTIEDWDEILGVNAKAMYMFSHAVLPKMMEQKSGNIINITSIMGEFAGICQSIYNVSKGATKMLTQAIAKDMSEYGIRCNAVAPGMILTGLTENMFSDENMVELFKDKIPMKRIGMPEEVAEVVLFLASDKSSYINGATIKVDGGMSCAIN